MSYIFMWGGGGAGGDVKAGASSHVKAETKITGEDTAVN